MNKTIFKMSKIVMTIIAIFGISQVANARVLSIGSTGSDVVALQTFLIDNGYPIPLIESGRASKGYFGEQTRTAVQIYQEDKGLNTTGVIDSETYSASKRPILGAVTGPDFYSDYFNINGVKTWYYSANALTLSSTTCQFRAPSATTTLVLSTPTAQFTRLASSTIIEIGTAATPNATTTLITRMGFGPAGGTVISTTTGSVVDGVINPNAYITFKLGGGGTAGTVTTLGTCKLMLREL